MVSSTLIRANPQPFLKEHAPLWCILVPCPPRSKFAAASSLPAQIAKQVDSLARRRRLSENRVLVELMEEGIEAHKKKEQAFFELAGRFRAAKDPEEIKRLGDNLGRFVFGDNASE